RRGGRQAKGVALRGRHAAGIETGLLQPPKSAFEGRTFRLDPIAEMARGIEAEDTHAAQLDSLLAARFGVDDRLPVIVALAQPKIPAGVAEAAVSSGEVGLQPGRLLPQARRDRIVDGGGSERGQGGAGCRPWEA